MSNPDPIHPVMIVNQTGTQYIVRYKNQWIDGKSRCVSRKTVGKLEGKKVIFGRKFLSENPQYKGLEAIYEDNEIIFLDPTKNSPLLTALPELGPSRPAPPTCSQASLINPV